MRPLNLFGMNTSLRSRAIALVCAGVVTGCPSGNSSNNAPSPTDPTPTTSAAPSPMLEWSSATTAASSSASAVQVTPPPVPEAPQREIAGAAHILVIYKGAEGAPKTITRSKDDARKRAVQALTELKKDESKFAELVKKYSDDPVSKGTDGRLGNFERNVMPPAFSDACFAMKVDAISDVVETPRGFHIIKRTK